MSFPRIHSNALQIMKTSSNPSGTSVVVMVVANCNFPVMDSAYCQYTRIGWPSWESWDERENHISVQEECNCGIGGQLSCNG